jgi:predicted Zn-dependent protease
MDCRRSVLGLAVLGVFTMSTGFSFPDSVSKLSVPGVPAAVPAGATTAVANNVPDYLPPEVVDVLGGIAFKIAVGMHSRVNDPTMQGRADRVCQEILREAQSGGRYAAVARGLRCDVAIVAGDDANATGFPGGKVMIQKKLMDETKGRDEELAAILGHELVHALARHAGQRISKDIRREIMLAYTGKKLSEQGLSPAATAGLMVAMGLAHEKVAMQPFAREQESEADHEGMLLAARAGYDPRGAVTFWTDHAGKSGPFAALLAYHPADDFRIRQLNGWMPEAMLARRATTAPGGDQTAQAKR